MNKRLLITSSLLALILLIAKVSISRNDFAPVGNTGAPNEGSCGAGSTDCHNSLATQNQFSVDLVLTANGDVVDNNFSYTPGTTYSMEFTINNPSERNGFSLTTLNDNDTYVGTLAAVSTSDAQVTSSAPLSREYIGHTNTLGRSDWGFEWTAPSAGTGDVHIYANANRSNNSDTESNDTIIPFTRTISELDPTIGIKDYQELGTTYRILNNPIVDHSINVSLDNFAPRTYSFEVFDLNGQQIGNTIKKVLHGGTETVQIPLETTKSGIYLLKIGVSTQQFDMVSVLKL